MKKEEDKGPGDQITLRGSGNLLYAVFAFHATCITPFMRTSFGSEALGINGVGAFVILLFYGCLAEDLRVLAYLPLWMVAIALQRAKTLSDFLQGKIYHSRYCGYPWLGCLFVKREILARAFVEPLICLGVGSVAYYNLSEKLGLFFMGGAFSLIALEALSRFGDWMMVQRMRDAEIEGQYYKDLRRGGNWS